MEQQGRGKFYFMKNTGWSHTDQQAKLNSREENIPGKTDIEASAGFYWGHLDN